MVNMESQLVEMLNWNVLNLVWLLLSVGLAGATLLGLCLAWRFREHPGHPYMACPVAIACWVAAIHVYIQHDVQPLPALATLLVGLAFVFGQGSGSRPRRRSGGRRAYRW